MEQRQQNLMSAVLIREKKMVSTFITYFHIKLFHAYTFVLRLTLVATSTGETEAANVSIVHKGNKDGEYIHNIYFYAMTD